MAEENKAPSAVEQTRMRIREMQEARSGKMPEDKPVVLTADKDIRPVKRKPKKKSFRQKLKEAMFSEDIGNGSVSEHVFFKILIPSTKRVLSDMANTAINMALGLDPKTRTIGTSHTSNASLYRDRNYNRQDSGYAYNRRNAVSEFEWDEDTAKEIYGQISDLIDRYGSCSLSDAYSIMGMGDQIRSTDMKWGWTSMRGADVVPVDRIGDRWIVDMPPARPIG